jgi:small nuclear ribonucleoprotein (snRNP)-like protein
MSIKKLSFLRKLLDSKWSVVTFFSGTKLSGNIVHALMNRSHK